MDQVMIVNIGPLARTPHGNSISSILIDQFIKWIECYPLLDQSVELIAETLVDDFFSMGLLPDTILLLPSVPSAGVANNSDLGPSSEEVEDSDSVGEGVSDQGICRIFYWGGLTCMSVKLPFNNYCTNIMLIFCILINTSGQLDFLMTVITLSGFRLSKGRKYDTRLPWARPLWV